MAALNKKTKHFGGLIFKTRAIMTITVYTSIYTWRHQRVYYLQPAKKVNQTGTTTQIFFTDNGRNKCHQKDVS